MKKTLTREDMIDLDLNVRSRASVDTIRVSVYIGDFFICLDKFETNAEVREAVAYEFSQSAVLTDYVSITVTPTPSADIRVIN